MTDDWDYRALQYAAIHPSPVGQGQQGQASPYPDSAHSHSQMFGHGQVEHQPMSAVGSIQVRREGCQSALVSDALGVVMQSQNPYMQDYHQFLAEQQQAVQHHPAQAHGHSHSIYHPALTNTHAQAPPAYWPHSASMPPPPPPRAPSAGSAGSSGQSTGVADSPAASFRTTTSPTGSVVGTDGATGPLRTAWADQQNPPYDMASLTGMVQLGDMPGLVDGLSLHATHHHPRLSPQHPAAMQQQHMLDHHHPHQQHTHHQHPHPTHSHSLSDPSGAYHHPGMHPHPMPLDAAAIRAMDVAMGDEGAGLRSAAEGLVGMFGDQLGAGQDGTPRRFPAREPSLAAHHQFQAPPQLEALRQPQQATQGGQQSLEEMQAAFQHR